MSHVVFDIGGTNLRVARATPQGLEEKLHCPTPQDPKEGLSLLSEQLRRIAGATIDAVAGGAPGVIGTEGELISAPNLPLWAGLSLGQELKTALDAPVHIRNDAALAGLGEAHYGAGKGYRNVAYIGAGTGIGMSHIVDGAIDHGAFGFEAGHGVVDIEHAASLESTIGGRALTEHYGMLPSQLPRSVWDELTPVFAAGIWNTILYWSPEVVVLGGSMMNEETAFRLADVTAAVEKLRESLPTLPPLVHGTLRDDAGLEGARALLFEKNSQIP